jgi:hypothetical protein
MHQAYPISISELTPRTWSCWRRSAPPWRAAITAWTTQRSRTWLWLRCLTPGAAHSTQHPSFILLGFPSAISLYSAFLYGVLPAFRRYKDLARIKNMDQWGQRVWSPAVATKCLELTWRKDYAKFGIAANGVQPEVAAGRAVLTKVVKRSIFDEEDSSADEGDDQEEQELHGAQSELGRYLALPVVKGSKGEPLTWWKANGAKFPTLALMARSFLAVPASTAGLERMFSTAGRLHNDLKKRATENTIQDKMMAKFNTEERLGP